MSKFLFSFIFHLLNIQRLWVNVTDCPQTPCLCEVKTNATDDNQAFAINFSDNTTNIGYVDIENLQPITLYSFTLSCIGTDQIKTRYIQTDYGRPSVPQNITITKNSNRLRISWLPPLTPAGPIHNYRLTINQNRSIDNLPNNIFSYDTTEDYIYDKEYLFIVQACNTDRQNNSVCSNANDGKVSIIIPSTTTIIPSMTTTKPNSAGILSYSICTFVFLSISYFFT